MARRLEKASREVLSQVVMACAVEWRSETFRRGDVSGADKFGAETSCGFEGVRDGPSCRYDL